MALAAWPPSRATAADTPLGTGGGPISISADRMSADQNSRVVTFTGRVIARQDDLIITCDLMRVHYQQTGAAAPASDPADAAGSMPAPPPQSNGSGPGAAHDPALPAGAAAPDGAGAAYPGAPADNGPVQGAADQFGAPAAQADGAADPLGGGQEIYRVDCEGTVRIQQRGRLAVGQKALYLAKSEPRRLILTGEARIWDGANSVTGHQVVYYLDQNRSQVESRDRQRVRAFYGQGGDGQ
jgi:lipopolysaccharide export system protein LptA